MDRASFLKTLSISPLMGLSASHTIVEPKKRRPLIEAHRGYSALAPENTKTAIEMAIKAGADRVEIDLQLSSDGVLVVIHDETLDRTTNGIGQVNEFSFEALKRLDAGYWKDEIFRNERIPTLDEVFEICRNRVMVNIDLKTLDAVEPLVNLIKKMNFEDHLVITGLVPSCVRQIRAMGCHPTMFFENGEIFRELLNAQEFAAALTSAIEEARLYGLPGFLFHHSWVDAEITHRAHLHGLAVNVWGVDNMDILGKMLDAGVDALMCDDPDIALMNI